MNSQVNAYLFLLNHIKEIKIWAFFTEDKEKGVIKGSIRSRKYYINKCLEKYNGGGLKLAAGCKLNDWKQVDDVITDLNNLTSKK
jgi:phosphoesterase RecJ-like protein